ncbi:hypothetical protein [Kitasatospora sp. NPDC059817]|uniref:hypothetical protein n=1 Tax=Kitasatospora sp. NPDC059817 TaxID=3346961 RepID=UPI0036563B41
MAAREDTARDVRHEPERHGRHGRPRPFGGRFRLPTLRFSGAAMAMSTVVGISIATTLLLNEQQGVGRRAGVARVGTTPPPTPAAGDQAEAAADRAPTAPNPTAPNPADLPATGRPPVPSPSAHHPGAAEDTAAAAASPSASPHAPGTRSALPEPTGGQAAAEPMADHGPGARPAGTGEPATPADAAAPSPSAQPVAPVAEQPADPSSPSPSPTTPHAPGPRPAAPAQPAPPPPPPPGAIAPGTDGPTAGAPDPDTEPDTDQALTGVATVTPLGRDGLRHQLDLAVTEPLTALQTEFRLAPGELAPGSGTAWTDLPGAVVTAQQERGTLVYRFTTPAGTDVPPGHYAFGVRGTRPAAEPSGPTGPSGPSLPSGRPASSGPVRKAAAAESWSAAAFGIDRPRAVAALGAFGPVAPQPVAPQPVAPLPVMPEAPGLPPRPGTPTAFAPR